MLGCPIISFHGGMTVPACQPRKIGQALGRDELEYSGISA